MHVLLIHQYFNTSKGGFRTNSFSRYFVKKGHRVTVVTSNRYNTEWKKIRKIKHEGIDIVYIKNRYSNKMSFPRRVISFIGFMFYAIIESLKVKDLDVVYATSTPITVAIPGMITKLFRRIPFVFEVRDLWPELPVAMGIIKNKLIISFLEWFEKRIYFYSDHVIALSPGMKDGIIRTGYPESNVSIIPNGCDLDLLIPQVNDKIEIKGTNKTDFKLIYAGNFGIANGLEYVIDLAKFLKKKQIERIKFILVGDGLKREYLRKQIDKFNLTNVKLFENMPKLKLKKFIYSSDMGMQLLIDIPAFYYGTSPNKFFDYLAVGKPVFNNYPGWIADIITEHKCGIVVNRYDHEECLKKIIHVMENKDERIEMGRNASRLAKEKFNREIHSHELLDVFSKLYERHKMSS